MHWTSGDQGRAPITRYVIEARPSGEWQTSDFLHNDRVLHGQQRWDCFFLSSPDEGLWDILIKDIPKEVTSYTLNLDMLREGLTYDFRVIAVNDYGYGTPSAPSPSISGTALKYKCKSQKSSLLIFSVLCSAQKVSPFYEEWWFLVVIALVGLIFILLLVFILIIRGQSKKYTKKADSGEARALTIAHVSRRRGNAHAKVVGKKMSKAGGDSVRV